MLIFFVILAVIGGSLVLFFLWSFFDTFIFLREEKRLTETIAKHNLQLQQMSRTNISMGSTKRFMAGPYKTTYYSRIQKDDLRFFSLISIKTRLKNPYIGQKIEIPAIVTSGYDTVFTYNIMHMVVDLKFVYGDHHFGFIALDPVNINEQYLVPCIVAEIYEGRVLGEDGQHCLLLLDIKDNSHPYYLNKSDDSLDTYFEFNLKLV